MNGAIESGIQVGSSAQSAKKPVGRPRRLTLDAIVTAACEIGLERLDMTILAERLNTGVATLYSYVRGRDHLLELVSGHLADQAQLVDRGQSWQALLREHTAMTSAVFSALPHLITNLLSGARDDQAQIYSRKIIQMLTIRGFAPDEAIALYIEVTQLMIGSAICAQRRELLGNVTPPQGGVPVPLPDALGDYRPTLERLIRDEERRLEQRDRSSVS